MIFVNEVFRYFEAIDGLLGSILAPPKTSPKIENLYFSTDSVLLTMNWMTKFHRTFVFYKVSNDFAGYFFASLVLYQVLSIALSSLYEFVIKYGKYTECPCGSRGNVN